MKAVHNLAAVVAIGVGAVSTASAQDQPNILVIMGDDIGFMISRSTTTV